MGHKSKQLNKKNSKKTFTSSSVSVSTYVSTSHTTHKPKCHKCNCEQLFYSPLPNLNVRPPTEQVNTLEWFAPGSVQVCCALCSTVKPVYPTPCRGYCCNNNQY